MNLRRNVFIGLAMLGSTALVLSTGGTVAAATPGKPARSCASLASVTLPHTTIVSATLVPATATAPVHCAIQLVVTNPPANDRIRVGIWLPTENWNRRFQGIGGGGFFVHLKIFVVHDIVAAAAFPIVELVQAETFVLFTAH